METSPQFPPSFPTRPSLDSSSRRRVPRAHPHVHLVPLARSLSLFLSFSLFFFSLGGARSSRVPFPRLSLAVSPYVSVSLSHSPRDLFSLRDCSFPSLTFLLLILDLSPRLKLVATFHSSTGFASLPVVAYLHHWSLRPKWLMAKSFA